MTAQELKKLLEIKREVCAECKTYKDVNCQICYGNMGKVYLKCQQSHQAEIAKLQAKIRKLEKRVDDFKQLLNKVYCNLNQETIPTLEAEAKAEAYNEIGEWGNEPCPHRNSDFPCPDNVPEELQLKKRECRDCWQEKFKSGKPVEGE
jgi:TolA-binding protein